MPRSRFAFALLCLSATAAAAPANDRHVILLTLDGVRVQELFAGMDPAIANATEAENGISEPEVVRKRYWRDTPEARREALMPFFWTVIARQGQIFGDPSRKAAAKLLNGRKF